MTTRTQTDAPRRDAPEPTPCWKEVLQASIEGRVQSDTSLEAYLDQLKRVDR
ncbi:MAG: hypothetical protein AAFU80_08755 [Pseudomonadota bacterium]